MNPSFIECYLTNSSFFLKHLAIDYIDYLILQKNEQSTIKNIQQVQEKQAAQLCKYALKKVPFWREAHSEYFPARTYSELTYANFPVVYYSDLTTYYTAFLSDDFDEQFSEPADKNIIFYDKRFILRKYNLLCRALTWQGVRLTPDFLSHNVSLQDIASHIKTSHYKYFFRDEIGYIAHECAQKNGMHINSESFLIEILDDYLRPLPLLTTGTIVITVLDNWLMPLIRYTWGVRGYINEDACSCGRQLPRLFLENYELI